MAREKERKTPIMEETADSTSDYGMAFSSVSSAEVFDQLKNATNPDAVLDANQERMITDSLSEYLRALLKKKGLKRAAIAEETMINPAYIYEIFDGKKKPTRNKLIAIAFAMGLSVKETQQMFKRSDYRELYVRNARDCLILFQLLRKRRLDETDELLRRHGYKGLGDY